MKENNDVEFENAEELRRNEDIEQELRENPHNEITKKMDNVAGVLNTEERISAENNKKLIILVATIGAIVISLLVLYGI